jgi:SAM-dependent methyltransferase
MLDVLPESALRRNDDRLRQRYSQRLAEFGRDPRTLGWDTDAHQRLRFAVAAANVAMGDKRVLDVGCGFADFLDYLKSRPASWPRAYCGIDINPEFVKICSEAHPDAQFMLGNILIDEVPSADIVAMFGLLNLRFHEFDNLVFARRMIERSFECADEALVVDMLSSRIDSAYPPEDFVFYYDPVEMFEFALSLTPSVRLVHDYKSIPQREFMLIMRKQPWRS